MSEGQINALTNFNKAKLITTVFSYQCIYITELNVQEGEYVFEGGLIAQLGDLSTLWAEGQIYTSQYSQINDNSTVTVQLLEVGKEIKGKMEFVNPEINIYKRINLIRVAISNQGNQLKPGMPAYVIIKNRERTSLSLPADAVIRDSHGASVWEQIKGNKFTYKMVEIGLESNDRIEIKSGLKNGDVVVISGAYLLSSEYIFKKGVNPMDGMKM